MRRLLVLLAAGVALSGCGVLDEEGPATRKPLDPAVYGPPEAVPGTQPDIPAPRLVEPAGAVARALDGGSIGVVDPGGVVSIEPERLDTASDVSLEALHWTSWGEDGAEGSGTARMLTCRPSCANGGVNEGPARIRLSGVKICDGRRYFERGEVLVDPKDTPTGSPPATYLRAPC
jgi:hypothetical protein